MPTSNSKKHDFVTEKFRQRKNTNEKLHRGTKTSPAPWRRNWSVLEVDASRTTRKVSSNLLSCRWSTTRWESTSAWIFRPETFLAVLCRQALCYHSSRIEPRVLGCISFICCWRMNFLLRHSRALSKFFATVYYLWSPRWSKTSSEPLPSSPVRRTSSSVESLRVRFRVKLLRNPRRRPAVKDSHLIASESWMMLKSSPLATYAFYTSHQYIVESIENTRRHLRVNIHFRRLYIWNAATRETVLKSQWADAVRLIYGFMSVELGVFGFFELELWKCKFQWEIDKPNRTMKKRPITVMYERKSVREHDSTAKSLIYGSVSDSKSAQLCENVIWLSKLSLLRRFFPPVHFIRRAYDWLNSSF